MKYTKPLDLWAAGVQESIASGNTKLQRGQWLKCGPNADKLCRLVEVMDSGTLHVIHWQGTAAKTNHCFKVSIAAKKARVVI